MIRTLNENDRKLFIDMSRDFYASDSVLHNIPDEYHSCLFEELMRSDDYTVAYIIEDNGKTAGYALIAKKYSREAGGTELWLEELFIMPQFRGKGLGKEFLRYFSDMPASRLRLETEPDNYEAEKLYKSFGFEKLGYNQFIKQQTPLV